MVCLWHRHDLIEPKTLLKLSIDKYYQQLLLPEVELAKHQSFSSLDKFSYFLVPGGLK